MEERTILVEKADLCVAPMKKTERHQSLGVDAAKLPLFNLIWATPLTEATATQEMEFLTAQMGIKMVW